MHQTKDGRIVPTFVGIGPPKCGTTWLDSVLRKHPEVLLPKNQKEVFFFSRYFDRGGEWYKDLFPDSHCFLAVGEISTNYVLEDRTLRRIAEFNPEICIVMLLRDPTDRLVSHFRMHRENTGDVGVIEDVLAQRPYIYKYSTYGDRISQLLQYFERKKIFVAIFEEIFSDRSSQIQFLEDLAVFLGVNPLPMREFLPKSKVRETRGKSRNAMITRWAKKARRFLLDKDMEWLVSFLGRFGVKRELFLANKASTDDIEERVLCRYDDEFAKDRAAVEAFLGRPISTWRKRVANRAEK